jgi:predicted small metal-binding protein
LGEINRPRLVGDTPWHNLRSSFFEQSILPEKGAFFMATNIGTTQAQKRKVINCQDFPSETKCTLAISGTEDEVMRAAVEHAGSAHGHQDSPELRNQIRKMLKDEPSEGSDEQKGPLHLIA